MLHAAYNAGLRVSELVKLLVDDVRLGSVVRIRIRGKGRKERTLPLWKETASALRAWLAIRDGAKAPGGWPWAPIHRVPIPGSGTQAFFSEDINNNRSDKVTLVDVRFEKTFNVSGRHRLTGIVDIYNLLNSNAVTNMVLRTGRSFGTVIEALPPRTVTVGARWQW
jgi:integrase